MVCPECGEVIGSGPLDLRRSAPLRQDGAVLLLRRSIGETLARVRRLARRWVRA